MYSSKAHPMGIVPCAGLRYLIDTAGVTELKLFHFRWPGALGISENIPIESEPGPPGQFGHATNFKTPPAQAHPMWTS